MEYDLKMSLSILKITASTWKNVGYLDTLGTSGRALAHGKKARDGQLSIDEMSGGTFTISNGGVARCLPGMGFPSSDGFYGGSDSGAAWQNWIPDSGFGRIWESSCFLRLLPYTLAPSSSQV
jgi:hypothetical protein